VLEILRQVDDLHFEFGNQGIRYLATRLREHEARLEVFNRVRPHHPILPFHDVLSDRRQEVVSCRICRGRLVDSTAHKGLRSASGVGCRVETIKRICLLRLRYAIECHQQAHLRVFAIHKRELLGMAGDLGPQRGHHSLRRRCGFVGNGGDPDLSPQCGRQEENGNICPRFHLLVPGIIRTLVVLLQGSSEYHRGTDVIVVISPIGLVFQKDV
jgi:hypothetical protein